jgi:hypothetical protein
MAYNLKRDEKMDELKRTHQTIKRDSFPSERKYMEYIKNALIDAHEQTSAAAKARQLKKVINPMDIPELKKLLDESPPGNVIAYFCDGVTYFFKKVEGQGRF